MTDSVVRQYYSSSSKPVFYQGPINMVDLLQVIPILGICSSSMHGFKALLFDPLAQIPLEPGKSGHDSVRLGHEAMSLVSRGNMVILELNETMESAESRSGKDPRCICRNLPKSQ